MTFCSLSHQLSGTRGIEGSTMPPTVRPQLAIGPVMKGWGSWEWVGVFFYSYLVDSFQTITFNAWDIPDADAVIIIKHPPPQAWADEIARRSALIYCPVDFYGDSKSINEDAKWLK